MKSASERFKESTHPLRRSADLVIENDFSFNYKTNLYKIYFIGGLNLNKQTKFYYKHNKHIKFLQKIFK